MPADLQRLHTLLERLDRLELHVPLPHERAIHEVARRELSAQIRSLSQRLHARAYLTATPQPHCAARA